MIVHGSIEIFSVSRVSRIIILRALDVEIGDPTKLSINISIARDSRIIGHSRSFHLIHFVRISLALRLKENGLLGLEVLIKELLVVRMITLIEETRAMMVSLVPLLVGRSQHAVVRVLVHNHLDGGLCVCRID